MRKILPKTNADGTIRYALSAALSRNNPNFEVEQSAADVRWIVEAPALHQHLTGSGFRCKPPSERRSSQSALNPINEELAHQQQM